MNRSLRVAAFAIVVLVVGGTMDTPVATARGVTVSGAVRYHPLGPARIRNRADAQPLPAFAPRPFRVASYAIQTLDWPSLPMNGLSLPRLATPPNADRDGIPYRNVNGRNYYQPGNIASDGLRFVDAYVRTGNPLYLAKAVIRARKLRQIGIRRDGALYFPYGFNYPAETLRAPWVSAYSQGFALSLFVRLYRVTGEWSYVDDARAVAMSFRLLGSGRRFWVAYAPKTYLWLEEYPSIRPTHVLNGFNFALFGLYDYERLTRDPVATQLLEGSLATLRSHVGLYRMPAGISLYDLVHRTRHEHYHTIHIWQLADLAAISGDPYFRNLSALLAADHS